MIRIISKYYPFRHSMVAKIFNGLVQLLQTGVDRVSRLNGEDRSLQLLQGLCLKVFRQRRSSSQVLDDQLLGGRSSDGGALDVSAGKGLDAVCPDGQRRKVLPPIRRHGVRTENDNKI